MKIQIKMEKKICQREVNSNASPDWTNTFAESTKSDPNANIDLYKNRKLRVRAETAAAACYTPMPANRQTRPHWSILGWTALPWKGAINRNELKRMIEWTIKIQLKLNKVHKICLSAPNICASTFLCIGIFGNGCWQETAAIFFLLSLLPLLLLLLLLLILVRRLPFHHIIFVRIVFIKFRIIFFNLCLSLALSISRFSALVFIWIKMHEKWFGPNGVRKVYICRLCQEHAHVNVCALFIVYYFYLLPLLVHVSANGRVVRGAHADLFG